MPTPNSTVIGIKLLILISPCIFVSSSSILIFLSESLVFPPEKLVLTAICFKTSLSDVLGTSLFKVCKNFFKSKGAIVIWPE